jgi:hypothetical protein
MKSGMQKCFFAVLAAFWLYAAAPARAQLESLPMLGATNGYATNITSVVYFEPPHEQQVKMRMSGAEALPLPGALFDLKAMRVEKFSADGKLEAVVEAPRCVFAPLDSAASSAGRLALRSGDGKFRVEGEGFLWLQNDQFLVISNHVRTVIEFTPAKPDKS